MKRHAFTLVEMLTVIAVIAVLASLLMAGLSNAKEQATEATCRSNLGQIAKALALYATDFKEYPGTRDVPSRLPPRGASDWDDIWNFKLQSYTSPSQSIFSCPVDATPHVEAFFALTNYSYGYNAFGSGLPPTRLNLGLGHVQMPSSDPNPPILGVADTAVVAPSEMIAIGDLNDLASLFTVTLSPASNAPYAGGPASRHSKGANMVFCDGHSEFAQQKTWIATTDTARRRWNNDHQPHPETR